MNSSEFLIYFLTLLLSQIPLLVASIFGIWYSTSHRALIPRVSKLATWGFSLLISHSLIKISLRFLADKIQIESSPSSETADALYNINLLSAVAYPLFLVGIVLLGRAIFIDRAEIQ